MKNLTRRLSFDTNLEERLTNRSEDRPINLTHNKTPLSPIRRERSKTIIEEELSKCENSPKVESTLFSRVSQRSEKKNYQLNHDAEAETFSSLLQKPLILKLPQSESFNSLSDLIQKFHAQEGSPGLPNRGTKGTVSEMNQSTMDLSVHKLDKNHIPVPRVQASVSKKKTGEHLWYSFSFSFVQDLPKMFS